MNTLRAPYCETDFGHRDPGPNARFMDLMDGDSRVSLAEQQDYQPDSGKPLPVWLAIGFLVIFPLLVALVVNLVRLHFLP